MNKEEVTPEEITTAQDDHNNAVAETSTVSEDASVVEEHTAPIERPKLVLVGPPGAGKSTIGRRLSSALHTGLVDSDQLIEEVTGKSCGDVFSELGEPAFRELEAKQVARSLQSGGIVSLGGGAVLTDSTRKLLKGHRVVWVDVSAEEGARRTAEENTRPVLAASDPLEHYRVLIEARRPLYKEVSSFRARTDGKSPQKVVAEILNFLDT